MAPLANISCTTKSKVTHNSQTKETKEDTERGGHTHNAVFTTHPPAPPSIHSLQCHCSQVPTGTGEQTTSLARSTQAMGSSTARTPGLKGLPCSRGPGDRS
ncbi:hypothetical protein E2C01_068121 [Portunus trituberculatus]|uniref:Uncharacterized protein n=1 Tax=Portunus trituberculatus TaxID=210409 RepID=A0A5B7HZ87_PORTR|nr:hypothetical protein [Portunus trituberculatus]